MSPGSGYRSCVTVNYDIFIYKLVDLPYVYSTVC